MSSEFAVEPRSPSALAASAPGSPRSAPRRSVDAERDTFDAAGASASPRSPSRCEPPAPTQPEAGAPGGAGKPTGASYARGLFGKARAYRVACLGRSTYRWHLGMMLLGNVGDGIMLGASGRILGLLRVAPAVRAGWSAFVWSTGERLASQTAELSNANLRDNARAARAQRDGLPSNPLGFRNQQARLLSHANLRDMACCGIWMGIAACTLVLGATVWPVVVATTAVALALAWNRGGRSVAWENVRFNLESREEQPPSNQLAINYGSTIGTLERILCTAAQAAGLGIALAVELTVAPACMGATAALGLVVGTLAAGCAVGSAAKGVQACWVGQVPVPAS